MGDKTTLEIGENNIRNMVFYLPTQVDYVGVCVIKGEQYSITAVHLMY